MWPAFRFCKWCPQVASLTLLDMFPFEPFVSSERPFSTRRNCLVARSNLIWIQCEYFEIALFIEFWRKYYDGFRLGSIIISKWGCNTRRSLRWPSFHPVVLRCSSNVFVAGFSISSHTTGQLPQTTSSQIIAQDSPHNYHQWPKSPNQSSRSRGLIRLDVNEVTEEVAALVEFLNTHLAY